MMPTTIASPALWISFIGLILFLLALDLGVFHRKSHEVKFKEALVWSIVWISLAFLFNGLVYFWFGYDRALEFLTGYLIEKSLSVDNIFVFILLFGAFKVPAIYQHRVLFWGILGALIMRAILVLVGAQLLVHFHEIVYLFGAFLIFTGIKMYRDRNEEAHPEQGAFVKLLQRILPMTKDFRGEKFIVKEQNKWLVTPLFLVLMAVEFTDLVFAVDSIPAIFAVTNDPFIVFTSNIFAILGLRSLYFMLGGVIHKFKYLKVGLAMVLIFVGTKMVIAPFYKVPIILSLMIITGMIAGSIIYSIFKNRQ